MIVQYGLWLKRMATLDFGTSFATHQRPVFWQTKDKEGNISKGMIQDALPITLLINVLGLVLIIATALPLGVISALTQNRIPDRAITLFVFIGFAIPGFWLALMLMYGPGLCMTGCPSRACIAWVMKTCWLAKIGDSLRHIFLPVFISSLGGLAGISLFVRNGMLDVLHQDYITTGTRKRTA